MPTQHAARLKTNTCCASGLCCGEDCCAPNTACCQAEDGRCASGLCCGDSLEDCCNIGPACCDYGCDNTGTCDERPI